MGCLNIIWMVISPRSAHPFWIPMVGHDVVIVGELFVADGALVKGGVTSVITSKAANGYHFKTGQRDWPFGTENVLPCRLLWWQVGLGAPAPWAAFEHMAVVQ